MIARSGMGDVWSDLLEQAKASAGVPGEAASVGASAAAGAALGGEVGTIVPGVGNAIGTAVGAIGGAVAGVLGLGSHCDGDADMCACLTSHGLDMAAINDCVAAVIASRQGATPAAPIDPTGAAARALGKLPKSAPLGSAGKILGKLPKSASVDDLAKVAHAVGKLTSPAAALEADLVRRKREKLHTAAAVVGGGGALVALFVAAKRGLLGRAIAGMVR